MVRPAPMHEVRPRDVVHVSVGAGSHEARRDSRLPAVAPPLVESVAVDERAGILIDLHDEPLREPPRGDARRRLPPELAFVASRRSVEPRGRHAGHVAQPALEARLVQLVQLARPRPRLKPRDDRRIPRQIDQGTRAVGGDDLAAPNLAPAADAHAGLPVSPGSLTYTCTSGSTSRRERFARNFRWCGLSSGSRMWRSRGLGVRWRRLS